MEIGSSGLKVIDQAAFGVFASLTCCTCISILELYRILYRLWISASQTVEVHEIY